MPIEEKPQLLEFNCTLEGMDGVVWNVKYDPNDQISLHVSGNGQEIHCPAQLFEEVTTFLQQKRILKSNTINNKIRVSPTPGTESGNVTSSLSPPTIEGMNNTPSVASSPPLDALSSFDITTDQIPTNIPKQSKVERGQIVVNNKTVTSESDTAMANRAVIRSRVVGDDPQSAEKEAALLRAEAGSKITAKKSIKKRHQISE